MANMGNMINDLIDIAEENKTSTNECSWNGVTININHTLSLQQALTFVSNASDMCFRDSDGEYMPELKAFAIKVLILKLYANLDPPDDISELYSLIYDSDIVDFIVCKVNNVQLNELIDAVDSRVKIKVNSNIEKFNKQLNDIYYAFEDVQQKVSDMFSGIDSGDIKNLVSAISNGDFSSEGMAKAIVKEYRRKTGAADN